MRRLTVLLFGLIVPTVAVSARPNVLILITDDQRADTIAALGHPDVITPNLDSLVNRGLSMTSAYCLGANMGAVCRPSRNMILSGRTYFRWSHPTDGSTGQSNAPRRDDTLPAVFNAAGYETYHHGKQGNSATEIHKQFHHSHYLDDFEARWNMQAGREIVDDAVDFLENRGSGSRANLPWLMYLAFATPHDPRAASPEALAAYDAESLTLPQNVLPHHPFDNGAVLVRDEWTAMWPRTPQHLRDQWHDYLATITTIDTHIGRLLSHLGQTGQLDNTIIAFTSDHGLAMGSHGLMGKQNVYEDGYKAPMVLAGPGISNGKSDEPVYLMDLYPTLTQLSGIEIPATLDGKSFAMLAADDSAAGPRQAVSLSYTNVQRSVRVGSSKMIHYPRIHRTDYFDLTSDPHEMQPIADEKIDTAVRRRLIDAMMRTQSELGDPLELDFDATPAADQSWSVPPHPARSLPVGVDMSIEVAADESITAAAVGLDRQRKNVVALRLDLAGRGERRSSVVLGAADCRWMPLLDQLGRKHSLTGFHGTRGDHLGSLGFLVGSSDHTPDWGSPIGEHFEMRLGDESQPRRTIVTVSSREGDNGPVITDISIQTR